MQLRLLPLLLPLRLAAVQQGAARHESGWTNGLLNSACADCGYDCSPSAFGCGSCCDRFASGSCCCFDLFADDFGCGCGSSASPRTTSAGLGTCCCCCSETCGVLIATLNATLTVSGAVS